MSAVADSESGMILCASCGIAEGDDTKLRKCTACYLVRYCSVKCQKAHRKQHKRECKKRAAELRDERLFKQPESSHLGDCPICMIPLPLDMTKSNMRSCCSSLICNGCTHAIISQESLTYDKCPFCRAAVPSEEVRDKRRMKRVEAGDAVAMHYQGCSEYGKGKYQSACEYWIKAAELGYASAHWMLAQVYNFGHGVEQNEGKYVHHLEEAAIGGHPEARHYLGMHEGTKNNNRERAVKHWTIAATQGDDASIGILKLACRDGQITKEDFAPALRAYQAAVDAAKSPQREKADKDVRMKTWIESELSKRRQN